MFGNFLFGEKFKFGIKGRQERK